MPGRGQPKGEGPGAGGQGVLGIAAYGDLSKLDFQFSQFNE